MVSEDIIREYCPVCEPGGEGVVRYCGEAHRPREAGAADSQILARTAYHGGTTAEIDGPTNRAMCDFIHRRKVPAGPIQPPPPPPVEYYG